MQIRRELPTAIVEKVICSGEDITEYLVDNLPNYRDLFII